MHCAPHIAAARSLYHVSPGAYRSNEWYAAITRDRPPLIASSLMMVRRWASDGNACCRARRLVTTYNNAAATLLRRARAAAGNLKHHTWHMRARHALAHVLMSNARKQTAGNNVKTFPLRRMPKQRSAQQARISCRVALAWLAATCAAAATSTAVCMALPRWRRSCCWRASVNRGAYYCNRAAATRRACSRRIMV